MKKLKLTALLLLFATIIYGQQHKLLGHVTLTRKNAVSVSGGIGNVKINNGNSVSTKGFGLDYFYAIKATKNFSWGLNGGANYFSGSSDPFEGTLPDPFKVTGQITNVVTGSGDSKNSGYFAGLGPQFNFAISDKLIFSPIFQVGYLGVTQSEFKATQTVVMNGDAGPNYTKSYDLISQTQTKTSGLGFIPKIRMTYALTENLGLWVEGNYLLGPTVKNSITTFKPEPVANAQGAYNIEQMEVGTYTTEINETKHNAVGVNFGIVFGFGGNTDRNIHNYPGGDAVVEKDNQVVEEKLPLEIQKIIDAQDQTPIKTFEYVNNKNQQNPKSVCNFNVEKVDIKCDGNDQNGNKKYKITITYKNLSATGTASLGNYLTACSATATNGNYIDAMPFGSATISNLLPNTTSKTIIAAGSTNIITFDFVPNPSFASLNIKGNLINSATSCGNCDDIISLKLPNCCDACQLNPVTVTNNSIAVLDANTGTISLINTVTSPNMITRIEADLVSVRVLPDNSSCNKCNNVVKQQDNFVDANQMANITGWANSGQSLTKPYYPIGGSRALTFNASTASGVNIASGAQINHTIGVAPTSCCGDTVVIWIRYSVWDKDCKVCDKLVSATIKRATACGKNGGGGTGGSSPNLNTNQIKN
ncbi:hypothetical protein MCEGE10_02069 [Flavobacteriaceae bacterium]